MPRPCKKRTVFRNAKCSCFKPAGVPMRKGETIIMALDEFEALRLADVEGLKHEKACEKLGVSRPTFTRILQKARGKSATAITEGKALMIEGGNVEMPEMRRFECSSCGHTIQEPFGTGRPQVCSECGGVLKRMALG